MISKVGRGVVTYSNSGVSGAGNDGAVETEDVSDGIRGLEGGEDSAGQYTSRVTGSKMWTCRREPEHFFLSAIGIRVVAVVERVKNGGNPRGAGAVLYIVMGPLARLAPP